MVAITGEYRHTTQRATILQAVKEADGHLTAGEIFDVHFRRRDPKIAYGTVYRSLHLLGTLPTSDLRVTSTDPTPGAAVSYTVRLLGLLPGTGQVTSTLTSPVVPGTTRVSTPVRVVRR